MTNQGNPGKGRPLPEPPRRPTPPSPRPQPTPEPLGEPTRHVEPDTPWERPKK